LQTPITWLGSNYFCPTLDEFVVLALTDAHMFYIVYSSIAFRIQSASGGSHSFYLSAFIEPWSTGDWKNYWYKRGRGCVGVWPEGLTNYSYSMVNSFHISHSDKKEQQTCSNSQRKSQHQLSFCLFKRIYIYVHQFSHRFQTLAQKRLQKQSKQLAEWNTAAFSSELTATKHKEVRHIFYIKPPWSEFYTIYYYCYLLYSCRWPLRILNWWCEKTGDTVQPTRYVCILIVA
jgi:hypothetical protein